MAATKVYVLIRTSLMSFVPNSCTRRYEYFRECLTSVLKQTYDDITILILQDTRFVSRNTVKEVPLPKFCAEIFDNWKRSANADVNRSIHFYKANCGGPALALYNLRKELIKISPNDNDVVVLLDDDDFLYRESSIQDH